MYGFNQAMSEHPLCSDPASGNMSYRSEGPLSSFKNNDSGRQALHRLAYVSRLNTHFLNSLPTNDLPRQSNSI